MVPDVQLEPTFGNESRYALRQCAWCGTRLAPARRAGLRERLAALTRPVSHGLCAPCRTRLAKDCAPLH